jgi:hypothetical protein
MATISEGATPSLLPSRGLKNLWSLRRLPCLLVVDLLTRRRRQIKPRSVKSIKAAHNSSIHSEDENSSIPSKDERSMYIKHSPIKDKLKITRYFAII